MENIVITISRFVIVIFMAIYTFLGFASVIQKDRRRQHRYYNIQRILLLTNHFICFLVLYMVTNNFNVIVFYLAQLVFFIACFILYPMVYKKLSYLILNHMMMLFSISFVMLARLAFDSAWRQFSMACVAMGIGLIVPVFIKKMRILVHLKWIYAVAGIGLLSWVYFMGVVRNGAKNWISISGILIQPSEFVKILFVFFVAAGLSKAKKFSDIFIVSSIAAAHVLILVLEKDLGAALIFFLTYLVMIYIATGKSFYLFSGLVAGIVASVVAYKLFPHVRVRVSAWMNPFADVSNTGYQVAQSLFAIGTGGWFGLGIGGGLPTSIPIATSDFIFAAIAEEFGSIFALFLILLYLGLFLLFITIALKLKELFYKLLAVGLSIMYLVQVFLCIGGVVKFIPSTGVTLPLVSYGGSSVFSTVIIFCILQGLYLLNQNEDDNNEKEKRKNKQGSKGKNKTIVQGVQE